MGAGVREKMVRSAITMIARRGVQGASFAEVLSHSGAPRGSIYHHFPQGKDEMIAAALDYMATDGLAVLDKLDGADVDAVIDGFVGMWRAVLERSRYEVGCSVAGVTVTADSDSLRRAARRVFETWAKRLTELLAAAGMPRRDCPDFAWTMIAATEGAVIIARAQGRMRQLDVIGQQLHRLAHADQHVSDG